MFLTSVGYAVVRKYLDLRWATIALAIIGVIGFAFPILTDYRLPWGIDTTCVALLFFHTGYLIKHFSLTDRIREGRTYKQWLFWLCFSIVFAANIALIFINEKVNLRLIQYGNPVLSFVNAVVGTVIWVIIADVLASCEKLERFNGVICEISELSIVFLCINHITILIFEVIFSRIFGVLGIRNIYLYYSAEFISSMVLMLFVGRTIERTNLRLLVGRSKIK